MNITVNVDNCGDTEGRPDPESIKAWVNATLNATTLTAAIVDKVDTAELSIRIVDEAEGAELNKRYRGKPEATNVLSFPADLPEIVPISLLGDIVICAPVVTREAREQGKNNQAHWTHMVVHGILHLLGYDHINNDDAEQMEAIETNIVIALGFPPPYGISAPNKQPKPSDKSLHQ